MKTCSGLEVWLSQDAPVTRGCRLGLLANSASVDREFNYAWDLVWRRYPGQLVKLFSPQHGLFGEQQANMITSPHERHPQLGIPVYSLYSETRRPTAEMLDGIDILLIDLQDVGTRVYTFIWTVLACLEAAADAGIAVHVLDRPNPVNGVTVEGPVLQEDFKSFVGQACIPMRHAMTIGEMALWCRQAYQIDVDLSITAVENWKRESFFEETGLPWLPPSPNLPTVSSAVVYPGQVLLEGCNLSEGRGTTTPFEICGAPYVDARMLVDRMQKFDLPGVSLRPVAFVPTFDKYAGQRCRGMFIHVTDRQKFQSYRTTLAFLMSVKELSPDDFQWLDPPYEYEAIKPPIDILSGSEQLRQAIDGGISFDDALLDQLCLVE